MGKTPVIMSLRKNELLLRLLGHYVGFVYSTVYVNPVINLGEDS